MNVIFVLLFLICICQCQKNEELGVSCECRLDMTQLRSLMYQPIYTYFNTNEVVYPRFDSVVLQTGQVILLECPGYKGFVFGGIWVNERSIKLKCLYKWIFEVDNKKIDIRDIQCSTPVRALAKLRESDCGKSGGHLIEVGHDLPKRFLIQYIVCFDFRLQTTQFTVSYIKPAANIKPVLSRKTLQNGGFFILPQKVHLYYDHNAMRTSISEQLGLTNYEELFDLGHEIYPGKHYLVPKKNYYFRYEQLATYFFINIVPTFNNLSWGIVNANFREYAIQHNTELLVCSGTLGHIKLMNRSGELVPLYLANDAKKIPFPELFWKVVYDSKNKAGIAIIGINNYFMRGKYLPLCKDISSRLMWKYDKNSFYACTVEEWSKIVNNSIPYFRIERILGEIENNSATESTVTKRKGDFSIKNIASKFLKWLVN